MTSYSVTSGHATQMGVTHDGDGANFAVFSENATKIEVCLFSQDGQRETARLALPEKTGPVWHGYVAGLPVGQRYGLRAHGQYAPEQGHRFNPNKLLMDPYTRELQGTWKSSPELLGYDPKSSGQDLSFDARDSAAFVPKSIISNPATFQPSVDQLRENPVSELIYETHVKGLTQLHPNVAEHLRGTYEGLASDAIIDHLHRIGVTAIELLPVHSFVDDGFLVAKGLRNYWGYNTIGFFAPEPRYFGPDGIIGFRKMVQRFHDAGIKVYLDVVYNHTAEGDQRGPTLCYRGLDNAAYYRLIGGQPRYYVNDAGCGNSLNMINPYVLRMVMDSLRFWVTEMGIDGFRFDLATSLGRESYGFDQRGGFFDALRQDPVLSQVQMIAEPWDLGPGGYQLGNFPHDFQEWNDSFRDTARRYWKGDAHSAQELGARLLGSADTFDHSGRLANTSINFLTSHDGFTLTDLTSYNRRHNETNNENNQDGHNANHSDNCGVEGPTEDIAILKRRSRRRRNLMATLFLSQGTPMLLAGDEIGNSQGGNNNAYCQDNPIGWIDWTVPDENMRQFVEALSAFRRWHGTIRQRHFLHGAARASDGLPDVEWTDFEGARLQWKDPGLSNLCLIQRHSAEAPAIADDDCTVFIAFNRSEAAADAALPIAPDGKRWVRWIDTDNPLAPPAPEPDQTRAPVPSRSVVALSLTDPPAPKE